MYIKWLGHSSFLLVSSTKQRIITDPYHTGAGINYKPITESADIVTSSHNHKDHNNTDYIKGNPRIITTAITEIVNGMEIKGLSVFHDDAKGSTRGKNIIYHFLFDGINLCHMGDLGHELTSKQIAEIGLVDVLFVPVGGIFTINASQASTLCAYVKPKIIVPMHYKNLKVDYAISGVDEFIKGKINIQMLNSCDIEITKDNLPTEMRIIILQPAN